MSRILAIARQTFWEGVRMKIVLVFLVILAFIVLRLPFALRGDETLSGRLQTFLSYSLSALGVLLSLSTVFLSCSTLASDIRQRTIHLVVTKPVSRFEILLGKWLGVNLLNLLLIILTGVVIYTLAVFIKNRPEQFGRDRVKIDEVVWTARAAARPIRPDFRELAITRANALEEQGHAFSEGRAAAIAEMMKELHLEWKRVPPLGSRLYEFENIDISGEGPSIVQVRFKAKAIPLSASEILYIDWAICDPATKVALQILPTEERSSVTHQFLLRTSAVRDGRIALGVGNPPQNRRSAIYFDGQDALEVLYRQGGFEVNYLKALLLIAFRLAFLSAIGIFFGAFVSFPVACFCVLSIFMFCLGVPWWLESIGANRSMDPSVDPYGAFGPLVRSVLAPILTILLPNFAVYDGVANLIDGHAISGQLVWKSAAHTILYGVLLLALPGWLIFRSREIAEVTV